MASKTIKAGIIGAAGLSAGKLLEILLRHPGVSIHTCISESSPGEPVHSVHPQLRGLLEKKFDGFEPAKLAECDVVFSCKKAGDSFGYILDLLKSGARIIDLSGDYRLSSSDVFHRWYGIPHKHPDLLEQSVYGLPEWHREEIRTAKLIANPGCYTTTSILGCAPFVAAGFGGEAPIVVDAISGVSGAGRAAKLENQFISVAENVRAYRIGNHQHTPEIEEELSHICESTAGAGHADIRVLFVPHVGPYKIGIMATCYLRTTKAGGMDDESLYQLAAARYHGEPFVRVYEPGRLPQIENVANTNFCDIGVKYDVRTSTLVVISVTDNLIKGAAGQAVQNMNIMFGFDETAALL